MASQKEAIAIVLDVGRGMGATANERDETFLDLAAETIGWIVSRKIFSDSKDELALILFGSDLTDNPLSDTQPGRYQGVHIAQPLKPASFDFVRHLEGKVRPTDNDGDFLEALECSLAYLREAVEGKKIVTRQIVLFSNFAADANPLELTDIVEQFRRDGVELNVIGVSGRRDGEEGGDNDGGNAAAANGGASASLPPPQTALLQRTPAMEQNELVIRQMLEDIGNGEAYSIFEAVSTLSHFQRRSVKPTGWKCDLEIGSEVRVPIVMYIKTKEASTKQSWKKVDASDERSVVALERLHERIAPPQPVEAPAAASSSAAADEDRPPARFQMPTKDEMQVDPEDIVKAYKFGTTLVPFSEADLEQMKLKGDGKCFSVLGFAPRKQIRREHFLGECARYVIADSASKAGREGLAALVRAMQKSNVVAVVRYCYNVRSSPRLGALFPKHSEKGTDLLIFVELPFSEDLRGFLFPPFPDNSKPTASQLSAVDGLISSMDLTTADFDDSTGERVEALRPRRVLNPKVQRECQALKQRALYKDQPLQPPEPRFLRPLEPTAELLNLARQDLVKIKEEFPLEVVEQKKKPLTAAEMFKTVDTAGIGLKLDLAASGESQRIGTLDPVTDFETILAKDAGKFDEATKEMMSVIEKLVFEGMSDELYGKAFASVRALRDAALQFQRPHSFNDFLVQLKKSLFDKHREDFWTYLGGHVGLIRASESPSSGITDAEADVFLGLRKTDAKAENEEALLDELE